MIMKTQNKSGGEKNQGSFIKEVRQSPDVSEDDDESEISKGTVRMIGNEDDEQPELAHWPVKIDSWPVDRMSQHF